MRHLFKPAWYNVTLTTRCFLAEKFTEDVSFG